MIARHYTVKITSHERLGKSSLAFNAGDIGIKRHYTEAFCLRKDIYNNLIALADPNLQLKRHIATYQEPET
jgi:hypothetical protein